MTENNKRFEDWIEVECNNCERYWINQCDGAKPPLNRSRMPCNSFLATRGTNIPLQIKSLKKANKRVWWALSIFMALNISLWILWFTKG